MIVDYDSSWPSRYEAERRRLAEALKPIVEAIEHIGSTAVPGMGGKPTIDILVGTRRQELAKPFLGEMSSLGYEFRGQPGVAGRYYFRKGLGYPRTFNVHVVLWGSRLWDHYLLLRDYLRAHPEEARGYAALKSHLAQRQSMNGDTGVYSRGKASFLREMLPRARHWREATSGDPAPLQP